MSGTRLLPLNAGSLRPTQGRTLAAMQVSGGSQSFDPDYS
jgi:arsenic resistance protein ArsH